MRRSAKSRICGVARFIRLARGGRAKQGVQRALSIPQRPALVSMSLPPRESNKSFALLVPRQNIAGDDHWTIAAVHVTRRGSQLSRTMKMYDLSTMRIWWYWSGESRLVRLTLDPASSVSAPVSTLPSEISRLVLESVMHCSGEFRR